jgi:hypothetical protein
MAVPDFEAALDLTMRRATVGSGTRLTTEEIARAFPPSKRSVSAMRPSLGSTGWQGINISRGGSSPTLSSKRTLAEKRVAFEVPHGEELEARLSSVLAVVYLVRLPLLSFASASGSERDGAQNAAGTR